MKNMESLQLPSDPTPNSLPLQGGKVSSHSSSKLSSLEGVWLPKKLEKKRESERNWKRAGELKASRHFINEQKEMFHTVLVWGFYSQSPFTN